MKKVERNKIYKKALHLIMNDYERFMCHALMKSTEYNNAIDDINFPEFYSQKPKNAGYTWFNYKNDDVNKQKRIEVLKKCINLTKPKSNVTRSSKTSSKRASLHKSTKRTGRRANVARGTRKNVQKTS